MPKTMTIDELQKIIDTLPYNQFREMVEKYSAANATNFETEMHTMVTSSLQEKLIKLGINSTCPNCNSKNVVKDGLRNHIQRFKCKDCGKKFTVFTDTIMEKTRWHWDVWVRVLEMLINDYSLSKMIKSLENDYGCYGIDVKTVWLFTMKLIHAMASQPMPKLTGVVQIDETFVRESQKGSHHLVSYLNKGTVRKPRVGRVPSKLGTMGSEFATVVTAVDNRGYCVCKVSSLGRLTIDVFFDLFHDHFDNPSYICTDANPVYKKYCDTFNIPHYTTPSNYRKILENAGYCEPEINDPPVTVTMMKENNTKIIRNLYYKGHIDRIENKGFLHYEEFFRLKRDNSLSLGRVNQLHSDLKFYIYALKTNVSTKYLQDYVGCFTYLRNWKVKHGYFPSSKKDAEAILIDILQMKKNYTTTDIGNNYTLL